MGIPHAMVIVHILPHRSTIRRITHHKCTKPRSENLTHQDRLASTPEYVVQKPEKILLRSDIRYCGGAVPCVERHTVLAPKAGGIGDEAGLSVQIQDTKPLGRRIVFRS